MDKDPVVASLSLTHVHYDPNDPLSHFCAFLALVPQGLIVAYVVLCWSSREIEIILAFGGQLACEGLNFALKRLIREERPHSIRGKGYGMPSSHAQFVAFFAVYIGLFVLRRHRPSPEKVHSAGRAAVDWLVPSQYAQQVLVAVALVVNAAMVSASRVYLMYHTQKQVFVGIGAGTACALAWYAVTAAMRQYGLIDWALDLTVMRLLRIRDLLLYQDLIESGYREYEELRSKQRNVKVKKAT